MKPAQFLISLFVVLFVGPAFSGDMVRVDAKTFKGCEGEGCGCTHDKKSNASFQLFKKMDKKSKLVGNFKKNTRAEVVSPYTVLTQAGKAKVTEVTDSSLSSGLKVNDVITPFFYEGEGVMRAMLNNKWIIFEKNSVKLEIIQEQKTEFWLELKVGGKRGFAPTFPFTSCH